MEDDAPTYYSKVAKQFKSKDLMETLSYPAQSPDLNPIKNAWKQLKLLVNKCYSGLAWWTLGCSVGGVGKIGLVFINFLANPMPKCVQAVYRAKGKSTKY